MPRKPKKQFNARLDERVVMAIDKIAEKLDTTKTDAVKYAVLTTLESLENRELPAGRELKVEYDG